ncbi:Putative acetyltransferase EpsM [Halomicronema hongdechloris C2206]|uniref:Acetyltransferase EpsM n=1 Tax=Halomicronema hongdechloris C2206 TaxID=1641165 RepID=A0A1Z3HL41_9CYAN|nr:acetyltransferase [Halomicronema hongdechloris]ASC70807.1 Putative acetyltransferase EpsM [Halomicronema hongdechloris C2206]
MSLYIYGAGGHGKVVLDILLKQGRKVTAFVDDSPALSNQTIHGVPVYQGGDTLAQMAAQGDWIVAIGSNPIRQHIAEKLTTYGASFTSAIHPSAQIAIGVNIRLGTVIMANAVLNTDAQIGHHVIINTGATIDHDCVIGDYCHVAPGCSLCGQVTLGTGVLLGVGSHLCPGVTVGEQTICGAGAVVVKSLPSHCLAYGCPAKIMRSLGSP